MGRRLDQGNDGRQKASDIDITVEALRLDSVRRSMVSTDALMADAVTLTSKFQKLGPMHS